MNSCIYTAHVMHHRLQPRQHRFHYKVFMFYIDLDELPMLSDKLFLFSNNRFNFFSFRDKEHLQLPIDQPDTTKTTRAHITDYLEQQGVHIGKGRIMLLTNLNVLGYNFNPVSFYYCFNEQGQPACCVAEVSNTYREMKPYFISNDRLLDNVYRLNTTKYFYVSPFIDHDTDFHFHLPIPSDKLAIKIDDYKKEERFFISTLTGHKKALTNASLLWYSIRFPFITLQIMLLIYWNALRLWYKKIAFHPKAANQHLQKGVYKRYISR